MVASLDRAKSVNLESNSVVELTKLPFQMSMDSLTNWRSHTQEAIKFGADMALRRLHKKGIVRSASLRGFVEDNDPTPTKFNID